nr:hypothetical protein SEVIR_3G238100v2 [Setaria viridis]
MDGGCNSWSRSSCRQRQAQRHCHATRSCFPGPTVACLFMITVILFFFHLLKSGDGCANIVRAWMVHAVMHAGPGRSRVQRETPEGQNCNSQSCSCTVVPGLDQQHGELALSVTISGSGSGPGQS